VRGATDLCVANQADLHHDIVSVFFRYRFLPVTFQGRISHGWSSRVESNSGTDVELRVDRPLDLLMQQRLFDLSKVDLLTCMGVINTVSLN
jgi:hypothetical protein